MMENSLNKFNENKTKLNDDGYIDDSLSDELDATSTGGVKQKPVCVKKHYFISHLLDTSIVMMLINHGLVSHG